jgi:site-specific DNA-cytosine methylase
VAQRRLTTLSTIRPEQLSQEAIHGAHSHLPQDIRLITRRNTEQLEKPDLVVVGFPCQGFSMASDTPKGLQDPRTALFQEALRVLHLIWRIHGPCGYLFENLDAMDHPVAEVRRKYCCDNCARLSLAGTLDS